MRRVDDNRGAGPPSVRVLDAVQAPAVFREREEVTDAPVYRVVEEAVGGDDSGPDLLHFPRRKRFWPVQFLLEFVSMVFGMGHGLFRGLVGLLMPLGVFSAAISVVAYFVLDKNIDCLVWAGWSLLAAFISFTLCAVSGGVQAWFDGWVSRGRVCQDER